MRIGIPKEVMKMEGRVALGPTGAGTLVADGHEVIVQAGAGANSSIADEESCHAIWSVRRKRACPGRGGGGI